MSPFHHWHRGWASNMHHMHYHRGPSRFIWFIIGAAAATWYHKRPTEFKRDWEHCKTVRVLPPSKEGEIEEEHWRRGSHRTERHEGHGRFEWTTPAWGWDRQKGQGPIQPPVEVQNNNNQAPPPVLEAQPAQPTQPVQPAPTWPWDSQAADEVMAEMSKRASETLTELSSTLQSFNAKLAQREKERKEMEKKKEEERLNPPRFV